MGGRQTVAVVGLKALQPAQSRAPTGGCAHKQWLLHEELRNTASQAERPQG